MKAKVIIPALLGAAAGAWIWQKTRVSLPEGAVPVRPFDVKKYLGDWFEIARFDYRFEKGLKNVSAHYELNDDDTVKVTNRGQNIKTGEWSESTGKAKFVDDENTARLKVSFFGPFYAAYTVIGLEDYRYALVVGNDLDYMWLLSREQTMPESVRDRFLEQATAIGYDISKLIWTEQDV